MLKRRVLILTGGTPAAGAKNISACYWIVASWL